MSGEVSAVDQVKCAHTRVYYSKHEDHGVVHSEHWYCTECHLEFSPMTWGFEPQMLTVMEPVATLRDQFAMASMQAMLTSELKGYLPDRNKLAGDAYFFADGMMEARKT